MPNTLLDLPRELRDMIYKYVLISPTGFIQPTLITTIPLSNPRFTLCVHPLQTEDAATPKIPCKDEANIQVLSLSIRRICRQVHDETQRMFFERNTFHFATFYASTHCLGVVETLQSMGQVSSRLIQTVTLSMPLLSRKYDVLPEVLESLRSQAQDGSIKRLELVWGLFEYEDLVRVNKDYVDDVNTMETRVYERLLDWLDMEGWGPTGYDRVIRLPARGKSEDVEQRELEDNTAMHLSMCWEGSVFLGDELYPHKCHFRK